jgi:hypothetical protein
MERQPRFDIAEAGRRMRSAAGGIADPERGIPAEIGARLRAMRETAREHGEVLLPPLLILGTSERVGSNWISDTLRPVLGQHNEPFRQQLAADHPLSPLNPHLADVSDPELSALSRGRDLSPGRSSPRP